MEAIEALTRYADMTPGKRCPDFDEDCAGVKDHAHCAAGSVVVWYGSLEVLPPIDGFCPYVCGMMGSNVEVQRDSGSIIAGGSAGTTGSAAGDDK